eukprot:TRINITY_DN7033_c0_g1_i1.p1 TRINITY_DN7033_c0_g1~~TRINITY_DN7033_c0_g1_i1.p1  ORF type:complete len:602 (-),score=94.74 TRINITY_DN7033_c0_g1_i1:307-2112(-)
MSEAERLARLAIEALGQGFDVTNDFRLKYCKSHRGSSLVELDKTNLQSLDIPGGFLLPNVSSDIKCDKGERMRFKSDVLEFNQMSELFNQRSGLTGKIPSGNFNAMFGLTGSWLTDATETKALALDGFFVTLYNLQLTRTPLVLRDEIKRAVSPSWDPEAIARFIEMYGTHLIVGVGVGGQNVIMVRQNHNSSMPPMELKKHLETVGDQIFLGMCNRPQGRKKAIAEKVPEAFSYLFEKNPILTDSFSTALTKDGLTVISSKRGGFVSLQSHCEWITTVPNHPEIIQFKFVPITSFLAGVPGSGFLNQAINLYLRYKPPLEELKYFLEFQIYLQWSPLHSQLPLGPSRRKKAYPQMRFSLMGPKIRISTDPVIVGRNLVTGIRLFLEGQKGNRLAIHLQHLTATPKVLHPFWNEYVFKEASEWTGSDERDYKYYEPVQWKHFGHVCTAPIKHDPTWVTESGSVFVVTGAKLEVIKSKSKKVLHLRLLFTRIPSCSIQKSVWEHGSAVSQKSGLLSTLSTTFSISQPKAKKTPTIVLNSGIYHKGPPVPVQSPKLLRYVDNSEIVKGPQDSPGHWVLTAARLTVEGGKIALEGKFSILNYPS